jgi:hypothetical protein
MSDFFAPSYWYGAGPDFSGLANAQASQASNQNYFNNQNATLSAANSYNPWANTPGGFGGQTAAYAGAGAAYGRQTGGFGATPKSVFNTGAAAFNPYGLPGGGGAGSFSPSPNYPGGSGGGGQGSPIYDPWTGAISGYSGGGIGSDAVAAQRNTLADAMAGYTQQYRMPQANPSYFNPGTYAGDQGNYGIPRNSAKLPGDIGFSAQPKTPNLGYNPGMQNLFANPGMNANQFQNRFGLGFGGQGTPSQYAPGAQMPPGFSGTYSADNPQGALPLGWNNSFNN